MIRVWMVDPSAFTPPYDHALCSALADQGAEVRLLWSRFPYGEVPQAEGYAQEEFFYRRSAGPAGSRLRRLAKLVQHGPDMRRLSHRTQRDRPDVVHFQWLDVQWADRWLLPRAPRILTAHDLLPREPRPGQAAAQRALLARMDALISHSRYGRDLLVDGLGLPAERVHVIPHGAFAHLTAQPDELPLPVELQATEGPVILFFGLLRPYKGLSVLLDAWRQVEGGELWIVGRPRMDIGPLRAAAPPRVRWVPQFVSDRQLPAFFRRAAAVVLPYVRTERLDFSGVLATALAFGRPTVLSDVGGFRDVGLAGGGVLVPPEDPQALAAALQDLLDHPDRRRDLAAAAARLAATDFSWETAAQRTLELYRTLAERSPRG